MKVQGIAACIPSEYKPNLWELNNEIFLKYPNGDYILVSKGTGTNGLTLPWFLEVFFPFIRRLFPRFHPMWSIPVICHDGIVNEYKTGFSYLYRNGEKRRLTWEESADVTLDLLNHYQCDWRKNVIYWSIRLWGNAKRVINAYVNN